MLQDTAVHEFFHVLQRKNPTIPGYARTPTWFLEGTATWAQWAVYPGHADYLLGITAAGSAATCNQQLVWEAPTITSLNPASVTRNVATPITISGAGFGPKTGMVTAGGNNYTPTTWNVGMVSFTLPGQPNPGTITIRVQTPTGALSNPKTLTIN